jgi:hypothetical protein
VLIAERILQRKIEFYNSPAMERGLIVEADARQHINLAKTFG